MSTPLPREGFALDPQVLWIMHCAVGPVPLAAIQAMQDFLPLCSKPWTMRLEEDVIDLLSSTRAAAGEVINASAADISLALSTSGGLITVAQGYPWREGDEVLLPLGEFPSNFWPWKALESRGVTVREVPLWEGQRRGSKAWSSTPPRQGDDPEGMVLAGIGPRTRVLAASWVRFQDGLKLDLQRLAEGCAARGVDLVVDGIQGAGTEFPDLRGCAAFASGGQKGLLSPQGSGLLWTAPWFREKLAPPGGWMAVDQGFDFSRASTDFARGFVQDGMRLEQGTTTLIDCAGFRAALETLLLAGVEQIRQHVLDLQEMFLERLSALPAWAAEARRLEALRETDRLGPFLSLHHEQRGPEGLKTLMKTGFGRGIYSTVREGYLRIALHGWHDEDDLDRLIAWLA